MAVLTSPVEENNIVARFADYVQASANAGVSWGTNALPFPEFPIGYFNGTTAGKALEISGASIGANPITANTIYNVLQAETLRYTRVKNLRAIRYITGTMVTVQQPDQWVGTITSVITTQALQPGANSFSFTADDGVGNFYFLTEGIDYSRSGNVYTMLNGFYNGMTGTISWTYPFTFEQDASAGGSSGEPAPVNAGIDFDVTAKAHMTPSYQSVISTTQFITAGTLIEDSELETQFNAFRNTYFTGRDNLTTIQVNVCHSSCHQSCHGSRSRR